MKKFAYDPFYEEVLQEMNEAADTASKEWLARAVPTWSVVDGFTNEVVGSMLDMCGGAYLEIKDGRKSFCKYVKARCKHLSGDSYCHSIPIHYVLQCRQEMGLAEAAKTAAFNVLKKFSLSDGIIFRSYID
jgi:hypothetical protein